ncbi:M23 family metallopeptidase [Halodesulfovibrio spirochaetisodalis]|uniref:M23 family metallopeptidase n=1 Tax=Halodesulfovibrio spirochaetisodalis TaxID=1560234 RepID=UPI000829D6C6|nr:peptidoglycan DD-metalloendopeptidase family protein [Halodesulfovibrio spirochaetisodalis]
MSIQQKISTKKVCLTIVSAIIIAGIAYGSLTFTQNKQTSENTTSVASSGDISNTPATPSQPAEQVPQPIIEVVSGKIGKGETASTLLNKWLSKAEVYRLASATDTTFRLTSLRRGRPYRVVTTDGEFTRFEYEIDNDKYLSVAKIDNGYDAELKDIEYDVITERVNGTISSNLYEALAAAGEKAALAARIGDIFGWEIDFIRDIRKNDNFTVVVEKRFRDGKFQSYGKILAARFMNQGNAYEGYYLKDNNGFTQYYTAEGKNLRRAFLKAPLSFTRISSKYSNRRLHPILKTYRPHHGIDYAAPRGTPVSAIGNGKVIKIARSRGAGKYVKIRHSNGYESAYLHLNRFARGLKVDKKVKQGQTIAYVGSTGLSTGPHLDFRMKKNGKYINPTRAINPRAPKATKEQLVLLKEKVKLLHPEETPVQVAESKV